MYLWIIKHCAIVYAAMYDYIYLHITFINIFILILTYAKFIIWENIYIMSSMCITLEIYQTYRNVQLIGRGDYIVFCLLSNDIVLENLGIFVLFTGVIGMLFKQPIPLIVPISISYYICLCFN